MTADGKDRHETISDAAIAEMEAGIYGLQVESYYLDGFLHDRSNITYLFSAYAGCSTCFLFFTSIFYEMMLMLVYHFANVQIIKNADLEELQELGSGTFGTVYHGKWRGTDIAIKRIKKSCFSDRSSEQERLVGSQTH